MKVQNVVEGDRSRVEEILKEGWQKDGKGVYYPKSPPEPRTNMIRLPVEVRAHLIDTEKDVALLEIFKTQALVAFDYKPRKKPVTITLAIKSVVCTIDMVKLKNNLNVNRLLKEIITGGATIMAFRILEKIWGLGKAFPDMNFWREIPRFLDVYTDYNDGWGAAGNIELWEVVEEVLGLELELPNLDKRKLKSPGYLQHL